MDSVTQEAIREFFIVSKEAVESGQELAMSQVPDVINQFLTYELFSNLIQVVLLSGLIVLTFFITKRITRECQRVKTWNRWQRNCSRSSEGSWENVEPIKPAEWIKDVDVTDWKFLNNGSLVVRYGVILGILSIILGHYCPRLFGLLFTPKWYIVQNFSEYIQKFD